VSKTVHALYIDAGSHRHRITLSEKMKRQKVTLIVTVTTSSSAVAERLCDALCR